MKIGLKGLYGMYRYYRRSRRAFPFRRQRHRWFKRYYHRFIDPV